MTEQKQAEAQLHQVNEQLALTNAELYRATRLKDEFLANMSHELRTPLNAILGLSEVLLDNQGSELSDRQRAWIESIEQSGQHLLALINDILDLAKVESGKLELQLAPTSVAYLCQSSLTFVRQQAITKNIRLTTEYVANLPDIMVDELRMRQVLINLLNNAVKFTPNGGSVKLLVQLDADAQGPLLSLSVIDTGIGIPQSDMGKLFQPFTQIDSQLNRKHTGTGLGLSLVRRLVELHQGSISVSSNVGQGSCFTVRLPCQVVIQSLVDFNAFNQASERSTSSEQYQPQLTQDLTSTYQFAVQDPASIQTSSTKALILIAEDHEVHAMTISNYLQGRGYACLRAHNGKEAIELAREYRPDLILMDIQMPEMDGLTAIRHIRADPALKLTPIIAVTALAMPQEGELCMQAGANNRITKPVKLKQLAIEIQRLLLDNSVSTG